MIKKYCLSLIMFCTIFFITSCISDIKTPSDTIKSPVYKEKDKIFNEYKEYLRENKPPEELLKFLKENINKFSEENADIAVKRMIELQEELLPKHEEKVLEYTDDLSEWNVKKEFNQLSPETKEWINDAKSNGYKITKTNKENVKVNVKIDYDKINKIVTNYVTDELKDYIKIESDDYSNNHFNYSEKEYLDDLLNGRTEINKVIIDGYLNDMAKKIHQIYIYVEHYTNSPYLLRVKELRKIYLDNYFFGTPNNPSFEHYKGSATKDNKLKDIWLNKYVNLESDSQKWKNDMKISKQFIVEINNYVNELDKNSFMLNEKTNENIHKIIDNNMN